MRLAALSALVFLVNALSGCTAPDVQACAADACASEAPLATPPAPALPPPRPPEEAPAEADLQLHTLRFEGCTGLSAKVEVPHALARAVVPNDFKVLGFTTDTAALNLNAILCPRAANETQVFQNLEYFLVSVLVEPRDKSWATPEYLNRYVLDFFVDGSELLAYLSSAGLPAGTAVITRTDLPGPGGAIPVWHVANGSQQFDFDYRPSGLPTAATDNNLHLWFGRDTYRRVDSLERYRYHDLLDAGLLRMSGDSTTARLVASPTYPWVGQAFYSFDRTWTVQPDPFIGSSTSSQDAGNEP